MSIPDNLRRIAADLIEQSKQEQPDKHSIVVAAMRVISQAEMLELEGRS